MEQKEKIVIALNNAETSEKLKALLSKEGYQIVALCNSGNELIRAVLKYSPDLALVGYKYRDMSLLDVYDTLYDQTNFLLQRA